MQGEKIELLKSTLRQMLDYMGETDRLGFVQFDSSAQRILPFTVVNSGNKDKILSVINQISAGGGTSIDAGVAMGIKMLQDRRYKNAVTSIFLLSDGQDGGAD